MLVKKVDNNDIVLLPIAVATADALFNTLRIPRQVVVHNQTAKLKIDALRRSLGSDEDARSIAEFLHDGGFHVSLLGARDLPIVGMTSLPLTVDSLGDVIIVRTIQKNNLPFVSVVGEQLQEVFLGTARFGEYNSLALTTKLLDLFESLVEGEEKVIALSVLGDTLG